MGSQEESTSTESPDSQEAPMLQIYVSASSSSGLASPRGLESRRTRLLHRRLGNLERLNPQRSSLQGKVLFALQPYNPCNTHIYIYIYELKH